MKRYDRVKLILEEAVEAAEIGAHGNFWRALALDEFKEKKVFGKKLVEPGNAENSNLIKALEGRAPFGADLGTPGATTNRMPSGFPPVPPEKIGIIRKWIDDGCPDEEEPPVIESGVEAPPEDGENRDTNIVDLLKVPAAAHDLGWLAEALQSAAKLELATLPPYLCALWSIDSDKSHAAYPLDSIKTIVVEEMRHLGLVCNMLTTLGVTPKLNTPEAVPTFPGPLPGGVNPQLIVTLKKLSVEQLETFMEIEKPDHPPIMPIDVLGGEFDTIGLFYDAILDAFKKLPPEAFKGERQVTRGGLRRIAGFADAEFAIDEIIKKQGEGTEQSPEDQPGVDEPDLAHYYRFRELAWGRRFVKNAAGQWVDGDPIPFPSVYDMADIPAGGYAQSRNFDLKYTELLNSLQKTWETGSNVEMGAAIGLMFELEAEAKTLMQTPIDPLLPEKGCFGPSFLLILDA